MTSMFLTGMMRSGTTLLQRALDQHPDVSLSYQNKTKDFLNIKKTFHEISNINKYHLLSHYSPNYDYHFSDFQHWISNSFVADELLPSSCTGLVGVKEVLAEEFLPFFIKQKVKCINIIRDPRDVIASMSFGDGLEHTGLERPVLFDIKNWRKSVLISYLLRDSQFLLTIRMEDLLKDPESTMSIIYSFLDIEPQPFPLLVEKINATSWKGNSSFGEKKSFDASAIGNYKYVLPKNVISYIETTCKDEMKYMGYERVNSHLEEDTIASYSDPFFIERKEFVPNYSSDKTNVDYELKRFPLAIEDLVKLELGGGLE